MNTFACKLLPLVCLCLMFNRLAKAQEQYAYGYYIENWRDSVQHDRKPFYDRPTTFKVGFHGAIGYMRPDDINRYILEDLNRKSLYLIEGTPNMDIAVLVGTQINYAITSRLQVCGLIDFARGISSFEIDGQNRYLTYVATRLSGGAGFYYYLGKKTVNPFVGAAFLFHYMEFEQHEAIALAPRFEAGAAANFTDRFSMEIFFQLNTPAATSDRSGQPLEIDFSTASAGVRLMFKALEQQLPYGW